MFEIVKAANPYSWANEEIVTPLSEIVDFAFFLTGSHSEQGAFLLFVGEFMLILFTASLFCKKKHPLNFRPWIRQNKMKILVVVHSEI